MRKWLWIAPVLLALGCSKNQSTDRGPIPMNQPQAQQQAQADQPGPAQPVADASSPSANSPESVAPPAAPSVSNAAPFDADPAPALGAVIPSGTALQVRVDESLSTRRNMRGDRFTATLASPVVVNGQAVLPRGTRLTGHVLAANPSGRLKGRARLVLALDSFNLDGRQYRIDTGAAARMSRNHRRRNLLAIGGGSGAGAAIGAIAGGGAGALIGAGAGAAAGTVGAAVTGRKQVTIPAESIVRFTLGAPVRV